MSGAQVSILGFSARSLALASCVVLASGLQVLGVRACSTLCADRMAQAVAAQLLTVLAPLRPPSSQARADETRRTEVCSETPSALRAVHGARPVRLAGRSRGANTLHGVRVSAAQVLGLASRRAMPQAAPVKANAQHPAGLLLSGVSALGVGLLDGDVLTEAAGQKALSVAGVVGVVLAARGRQVPAISGKFFRAGVPFLLTVEQPYPKLTDPG